SGVDASGQLLFEILKLMPQTVPSAGFSPPCDYNNIAADFDLTLLPTDSEVPYSPTNLQQLMSLYCDPTGSPPPMFPDLLDDLQVLKAMSHHKPNDFPYPQHPIKEEPYLLHQGFQTPSSPAGSTASSYTNNPSPYQQCPSPSTAIKHEQTIDLQEILTAPKKEPEKAECKSGDHQLLREVLRDMSFQKKYKLKPFDFDGLTASGVNKGDEALMSIEPVLSLAIEQIRVDISNTCNVLGISPDLTQWTVDDVKAWLLWTQSQYNLSMIRMEYFNMDGVALSALSEEEFQKRAPECGSTLFARLEIWKAACSEADSPQGEASAPPQAAPPATQWSSNNSSGSSGEVSDDDHEEEPEPSTSTGGSGGGGGGKVPSSRSGGSGGSHIHLWQFLKELLSSPQLHGSCIRWLDRSKGVFKIEDSVRVARLWGKRKNRPAMNYDKLSRSIRQYYKKGIMKKTERSQRLVYQFCLPYNL
ncbi:hypothetical protein L9F63_024865, partial [Diploptera punctata]